MNKHAWKSTPHPEVNVRSTTTASDTWLSCYLVVDQTLGTLQVLVHIVTINHYKKSTDQTKLQKIINTKFSWSTVCGATETTFAAALASQHTCHP